MGNDEQAKTAEAAIRAEQERHRATARRREALEVALRAGLHGDSHSLISAAKTIEAYIAGEAK